jgi:hypothetical protein
VLKRVNEVETMKAHDQTTQKELFKDHNTNGVVASLVL